MLVTRKILVCLDGSEMDETLLSFASFIMQSSPAEEIYFMQVIANLSEIAGLNLKKLDDEALKTRQSEIEALTKEKVEPGNAKVIAVVKKGHPFKEVLRFLESKSIDVVISGNKKKAKGSGVFNMRLARRAPCSLIVIPENHSPSLTKLLIPIDFSLHSQLALEYGVFISKSNDFKVEIICQNVYQVPTGYHYSGKSFAEFGEIMKENSKKEYDAWVSEINTENAPIKVEFTLDDKDDFGKAIRDVAMGENVSGILVGAKGRTAASALFIGSTAEKLIQAIDYLPLTIVRQKGANASVLESLREL